jgi:ribosomal protein L16/L10AE
MPIPVKQIEAARFGVEKERLSDRGGLYLRRFPNGAKRFQAQIARAPRSKARGW